MISSRSMTLLKMRTQRMRAVIVRGNTLELLREISMGSLLITRRSTGRCWEAWTVQRKVLSRWNPISRLDMVRKCCWFILAKSNATQLCQILSIALYAIEAHSYLSTCNKNLSMRVVIHTSLWVCLKTTVYIHEYLYCL